MSLSTDKSNLFWSCLRSPGKDFFFPLARPFFIVERKLRNHLLCEKAETRTNQDELVRRPVCQLVNKTEGHDFLEILLLV